MVLSLHLLATHRFTKVSNENNEYQLTIKCKLSKK